MNVVEDYFINQANVLDASYKASVVKGHSGDTGTNREEIIQKWLNTHIPRSTISEKGGKIIDAEGHMSDQIDLALYNSTFPHFGANNKSYFFAEGVIYAIQVKSVLTSGELSDAVKNLASVKQCKREFRGGMFIGKTSPTIPTGIFAYDTDYKSSDSVVEVLKRLEEGGLPPVNFVCINQKVYIGYNSGDAIGIDRNGKKLGSIPHGYNIIQNTPISIWNMLLEITNEGRKIVFAGVDFQKYMLNIASK